MSQPNPPQPPPTPWPPVPMTPPPNPPGVPPLPRYCCELAQFGDWCDCGEWAAQVAAAFAPRDLSAGRLGPIHDTRIGVTR